MTTDAVDRAFLAELEALEKFRISYSGMHPSVPLAREDPDVRRLIEAMAMFTARTRVAAERSVGTSFQKLFRQHFPHLLAPVPAMGMLRAGVTSRYVDVAEVPRGAEAILARKTVEGRDDTFHFRTLAKLRILPIEIAGVDLFRVRGRGHRLLVRFEASFPRNDEIGELPLYVNHLNDLRSSLTVLYELKKHLRAVSVVFDEKVNEESAGQRVDVRFGARASEPWEVDAHEHPLHAMRAFLHFPYQDLFLTVQGITQPRNWQRFALCFDLDDSWPTELRLTADAFQLHTTAIENVKKDMANPIECNGTRERWPLRHPDAAAHYAPLSVLAAYLMTEEGLVPLEPAVLGAERNSYEPHLEGVGEERVGYLALSLPGAFDRPERVATEATWHQPRLRDVVASELTTRLSDRYVDGVTWSCDGPLAMHASNALEDDREGLLQLLSIKSQRFLGRDELVFLLRALGAQSEKHFAKLVTAIGEVGVTHKPFARRGTGFKYVYAIRFDDLDGGDLPRLDALCQRLLPLLSAWSVEEVVELVARVPNLDKELTYA